MNVASDSQLKKITTSEGKPSMTFPSASTFRFHLPCPSHFPSISPSFPVHVESSCALPEVHASAGPVRAQIPSIPPQHNAGNEEEDLYSDVSVPTSPVFQVLKTLSPIHGIPMRQFSIGHPSLEAKPAAAQDIFSFALSESPSAPPAPPAAASGASNHNISSEADEEKSLQSFLKSSNAKIRAHYEQLSNNDQRSRPSSPPFSKRQVGHGILSDSVMYVEGPHVLGSFQMKDGRWAMPKQSDETLFQKALGRVSPVLRPSLEVPSDVTCGICSKLMKEASTVTCCARSYCFKCIYDELLERTGFKCPGCSKNDLTLENIVPNEQARAKVDQFLRPPVAVMQPLPEADQMRQIQLRKEHARRLSQQKLHELHSGAVGSHTIHERKRSLSPPLPHSASSSMTATPAGRSGSSDASLPQQTVSPSAKRPRSSREASPSHYQHPYSFSS